jgi:phage head maturation protease
MPLCKSLTGPADVLAFVARRSEHFAGHGLLPAHARRLAAPVRRGESVLLAYTDPEAPVPAVDENKACATFLITNARRDRHGDIVEPAGCVPHLANFERNPRVFFSHQSHCLPIASARDPDTGALALWVEPDWVKSTAYFHLKTRESEEVFALVACGELQACSIGFVPHQAELFGPEAEGADDGEAVVFDAGGCRFTEWDLLEWSVVPVPANPDAVALRLARGINNRPLSESVRKLLEPFAPAPRTWSPGMTFTPPALTPEALKTAYLQRKGKKDRPAVVHQPSSEAVAAVTATLADAVLDKLAAQVSSVATGLDQAPPKDLAAGALTLNEVRTVRTEEATPPPAEPLRWNRSLSKAFDVTRQQLRPVNVEVEWAAKFLGVPVKEIYETSAGVPSAKLGSFLCGWRDALADYPLLDVRNILYNGTEAPPVYDKIQLNSQKSEDFLVEGLCFYGGDTKLVAALQPTFFGLRLRLYVAREHKDAALDLVEQPLAAGGGTVQLPEGRGLLPGRRVPAPDRRFLRRPVPGGRQRAVSAVDPAAVQREAGVLRQPRRHLHGTAGDG